MQNDISQYDIPSRELLLDRKAIGTGRYTDIGEARVVSTILGNAKVKVTYRGSHSRTWLLVALVATMTAALAWQEWNDRLYKLHQEAVQKQTIQVSAPQFQPAPLDISAPQVTGKPGIVQLPFSSTAKSSFGNASPLDKPLLSRPPKPPMPSPEILKPTSTETGAMPTSQLSAPIQPASPPIPTAQPAPPPTPTAQPAPPPIAPATESGNDSAAAQAQ